MPKLTNLDVEWVSLVDRAAVRDPANKSEPQRFLIWKRDGASTPEGGEMTDAEMRAAVEKAEQERDQAAEALKKAETDRDALTARVTELEKAAKPEDKPADELNKADLPEPVRIALEKAEADAKASGERAEKAEKIAKEERDERLTRDFIAKAETLKALPVKADEFGPVLKSASEKLSKDEFEALETVLKAADEQIAKGELFKEQGRGGDAQKSEGALAEATKKAEEIRKADPKIGKAEALDMAFQADRALQDRYLAEMRG